MAFNKSSLITRIMSSYTYRAYSYNSNTNSTERTSLANGTSLRSSQILPVNSTYPLGFILIFIKVL